LASFARRQAADFWKGVGRNPSSGDVPLHVLTSTMPRAVASVCGEELCLQHEQTSALNPIDKGTIGKGWWDVQCDSDVPPWEEMKDRNPEFWEQWRKDPVHCRFPGGESYQDVVNRLEGLLIEVEQCTRPVLIVSHITVLQLLLAYFRGETVESAVDLRFPKNAVLEVRPTSGGGFRCNFIMLHDNTCPADGSPLAAKSLHEERHNGIQVENAPATKRQRLC